MRAQDHLLASSLQGARPSRYLAEYGAEQMCSSAPAPVVLASWPLQPPPLGETPAAPTHPQTTSTSSRLLPCPPAPSWECCSKSNRDLQVRVGARADSEAQQRVPVRRKTPQPQCTPRIRTFQSVGSVLRIVGSLWASFFIGECKTSIFFMNSF